MFNQSPKNLTKTSGSAATLGEPAREVSLQPEPDLDQVVQGFSGSLNALKGIIQNLSRQEEQEAAAALKYKAMEEYSRELFSNAPGGYLVTDTGATIQDLNQAAADLLQTDKDFLLGQSLRRLVIQSDQDTFSSLMDQANQRSGIRGSLVHLRLPERMPLPIFLTVAGRRNQAGELIGFNWLLQGQTKSRQDEVALKIRLTQLETRFIRLVEAISVGSEMQDPYASGHQQRVAQHSCAIAEQMGFSQDRVEGMKIMGCLHDVGKVAIPSEILNKLGLLTIVEANIVKSHPQLGYDLLKDIEFPWPVAQAILQHHERWNGSGYPAGLKGEDIIIEARILSVADVVDAMVFPRPYGVALGMEQALEAVHQAAGTLYDPQVVDTSLKLLVEKRLQIRLRP
jgi:HD-GYP domain-containing protein (c-di-GMP phosphodiesterase class II)